MNSAQSNVKYEVHYLSKLLHPTLIYISATQQYLVQGWKNTEHVFQNMYALFCVLGPQKFLCSVLFYVLERRTEHTCYRTHLLCSFIPVQVIDKNSIVRVIRSDSSKLDDPIFRPYTFNWLLAFSNSLAVYIELWDRMISKFNDRIN